MYISFTEIIRYYYSNVTLVLDCFKAFEKIVYSNFFPIINNIGICPLIIRILVIMYSSMKAQVNRNNIKSCKFKVNNGVKQAGVISPLLFVSFM